MNWNELHQFISEEHARLLKFYKLKGNKELRHLIALKLMEEVGELSEELLAKEAIQRAEKLKGHPDKLGDEIADVVVTVLLLAENLEVDVSKEIEKGIIKRKSRDY